MEHKKFKNELSEKNKQDAEALLDKYVKYFRRSKLTGPQRKYQRKDRKFYCNICQTHFSTTIQAMLSHALAHKRDAYIKIGKSADPTRSERRPEQHIYNNATGKLHFGAGFNVEKILIPKSAIAGDDKIQCRKCDYKISIDSTSMRSLGKRVAKMRRHESGCTRKNKKTEKGASHLIDGEMTGSESEFGEIPTESVSAIQ